MEWRGCNSPTIELNIISTIDKFTCRQGKKLPTQSWHWPIYQVQIASDGTVSRLEAEDDTDFNENRRLKQGRRQPSPNLLDVQGPVTVRLVYANGCEVTTLEKDFNEMTEEGLSAW